MADKTNGRSSEEIRRSIAETRSNLDETVDTLEDRLAPKRLVHEAWDRLKDGGGDVGQRVGSMVRDHPVPLALVGLGLVWFAIEEIRGRSITVGADDDDQLDPGTLAPAEGRRGPYGPDAINREDPEWEYASRTARVKAKVRHLRTRADHAAGRVGQARRKAMDFVDENPLAVGAVAFAVGLASGASAPASETENRVAGRAADKVKRQAREVGREAKAEARRLGREVKDEAKQAARDATERTARAAEDAAREARDETRAAVRPNPPHEPGAPQHPPQLP